MSDNFNTSALEVMKEIKTIEDILSNIGDGKFCLVLNDGRWVRGIEKSPVTQEPKMIHLPSSFKQFFIDHANGRKKELWQSLKSISEMALIDINKEENVSKDNNQDFIE